MLWTPAPSDRTRSGCGAASERGRFGAGGGEWLDIVGRRTGDATEHAAAEVQARYTGSARIHSVKRTSADAPPLDLRRPVATWQVAMEDGSRFYVDAASGQILATRAMSDLGEQGMLSSESTVGGV